MYLPLLWLLWGRLAATLAVLALLSTGPATVALADVGEWTSGGPTERTLAVAVQPSNDLTLLASGASGVWRTMNGGNAWNRVSETGIGPVVEVDPHQPNTIYATGADWTQVLKSTDGGAAWNAVYTTQRQMRDVLVDPNTPGTVYLGGTAPDGLAQIYRSTDGGATWKELLPQDLRGAGGIGQTAVTTLAALPSVKGLLFAGSTIYHGGRILKSTDGGDTWTSVYSSGAMTPLASPDALAVAGTSADTATVYASFVVTGAGSLIRSDNGGTTWVNLTDSLPFATPLRLSNVLVNPAQPQWVYLSTSPTGNAEANAGRSGIFASNDRGRTWTELGRLDRWVAGPHGLALSIPARTVYAATDAGVFQNTIAWPVLPRFQRYYDAYDGYRVMGTAISLESVVNGYYSQYFEKARLEDHSGESADPNWQLMYGLLVDELHNSLANLPVGGDVSELTYAGLHGWADTSQRLAPPAGYTGQGTMTVDAGGRTFIPFAADLSGTPGHLVPGFFWEYINRPELFPAGWLHDVGLPITAARQITVTKYLPEGPSQRSITVQAFQRAILTNDAQNPAGWQVERANVGSDYRKFFPERVGP
ncbi:MAG TPA: sialidase family protein [Chloroflexota bacterium]|nr:sialidase family protein [Chloroflexota bacterium]